MKSRFFILMILLIIVFPVIVMGQTAAEWFTSAERNYNNGNWDRAISDYSQVLRLETNNPFAYYNRGVAYSQKGDHDHAIADYSQAILYEPNVAQLYATRGWTYYLRAWQKGGNQRIGDPADAERAEADLLKALQLDPESRYIRERLSTILNRWHPAVG